MRIICTVMEDNGRPTPGGQAEWSAAWPDAAVSACLHDISETAQRGEVTDAYVTHLSDWLNSGDDLTIMYLRNGDQLDIWQVDMEED